VKTVKTGRFGRNVLVLLISAIIATSAAPTILAQPENQRMQARITERNNWKIVETPIITIMFPSQGKNPMFLWWYTGENKTVYVVNYHGLIEYVGITGEQYRHRYELTERIGLEIFENYTGISPIRIRHGIMDLRDDLTNILRDIEHLTGNPRTATADQARDETSDAIGILQDLKENLTGLDQELSLKISPQDYEDAHAAISNLETTLDEMIGTLQAIDARLQELSIPGREQQAARELRQLSNELHSRIASTLSAYSRLLMELADVLRDILKNAREEFVEALKASMHPAYLPFHECAWQLTPVHNITDTDGEVIGLAFGFTLTDAHNPKFEFAEDNVEVNVRFYYVPVEETSGDTTIQINRAEMKMDLVIRNWQWILDGPYELLKEKYGIALPIQGERLALWLDIASRSIKRLPEEASEVEETGSASAANRVMIGSQMVNIRENAVGQDEKPLLGTGNIRSLLRLKFVKDNSTLAGFFRFVNASTVAYPNGTLKTEPVKAAYLQAGGHLRLFLTYRYFDDGSLTHDPSLGVEVPETTSEAATTPIYQIRSPTSGQIVPTEITKIQVIPRLLLPGYVGAIAIIGVGIAVILFAMRRRGSPLNSIGS
jgi:hypothetical protein